MLNLRGSIVPIVDLRMRLCLERAEYTSITVIIVLSVRAPSGERHFGVVVDGVSDVIGVDPSGDVWTGNVNESVVELLGLGTPTAAPFYGGDTVITQVTLGNGNTRNVTTVTKGNLATEP